MSIVDKIAAFIGVLWIMFTSVFAIRKLKQIKADERKHMEVIEKRKEVWNSCIEEKIKQAKNAAERIELEKLIIWNNHING